MIISNYVNYCNNIRANIMIFFSAHNSVNPTKRKKIYLLQFVLIHIGANQLMKF